MDINKPTVLVDMDGVMANFDESAPISIGQEQLVEKEDFFIAKNYSPTLQRVIEASYNAPDFFENLSPMPGLFEGWQALIDAGYSPRVASAPLPSNASSIEGKIKWLDRIMVPEFGASVVEDAIIDRDKWKYDAVALIDDRPGLRRGPDSESIATWEHILFGWEHRVDMPLALTSFRLLNWSHTTHLLEILEDIQARN